ncbi:MAG: GntR family transcriptional regulator [Clostridia bacterium]|nr:GntR family transcriptional regulator [Clostridia bacterium]
MYQIDPLSRVPIYEQIADMTEKLVLSGVLKPGDALPSVRSLSVQLHTNPNTVAKAFAELDSRGIVQSAPGRGCYIRPDAADALKRRARARLAELAQLCRTLKAAGVDREEVISEINKVFNNNGDADHDRS